MLITKIRSVVQSALGKTFLIGLLLAFLLTGLGLSRLFMSGTALGGIASVNGILLDENRFKTYKQKEDDQLNFLRQIFQAQSNGQDINAILQSLGVDTNTAQKALDVMIQEELLTQTANAIPVHLSSSYIDLKKQDRRFLAYMLQEYEPALMGQDGTINDQLLNKVLTQFSPSALDDFLNESLKRQVIEELVQGSFTLPSWIMKEFYKEHYLSKKFSIGTIAYDDVLKKVKETPASEEALKKFFDEQNNQYKRYYVPAKRSGTQWIFNPEDFGIHVNDQELKDYYEKIKRTRFVDVPVQVQVREIVFDNVKEYGLIELKNMADKVYADVVQNPEKFAEYAQKHSMKKESASKGGLVEFFKRGSHDAAYDRAAFVTLKNDGDISSVLEVKGGYVIVQRVARKEATYKSFDAVRKEIVAALVEQKFKTSFAQEAGKVIRKKDESENGFEAFAKEKKAAIKELSAMPKDGSPIAQRLFSMTKSGDKVAFIQDGKGIVLELKDVLKKVLPPFSMLKNVIEADYYQVMAYKELTSLVKKERTQALASKTLQSNDLMKVTTTEFIDPSNQDQVKKFTSKGLPEAMLTINANNATVSFIGEKDGYVVQLNEIAPFNEELYQAQYADIIKKLYMSYKQTLIRSFIASLRKTATIEVNSTFDKVKDLL